MDRSDVITLNTTYYTTDAIGQRIAVNVPKQAFCQVDSVSRSEWFEAGRNGIKPQYVFTIFRDEYDGELTLEYKGKAYSIYRTYERKDDKIELYAEARGGVDNTGEESY